MAVCKFCGTQIDWLRDGRKSTPIAQDGLPHRCEEGKQARDSVVEIKPTSLSAEEIAKYEEAMKARTEKTKSKKKKK